MSAQLMLASSVRLAAVSGVVVCGATAAVNSPLWQTRQHASLEHHRTYSISAYGSQACGAVARRVLNCCERCTFDQQPLKWCGPSTHKGKAHDCRHCTNREAAHLQMRWNDPAGCCIEHAPFFHGLPVAEQSFSRRTRHPRNGHTSRLR